LFKAKENYIRNARKTKNCFFVTMPCNDIDPLDLTPTILNYFAQLRTNVVQSDINSGVISQNSADLIYFMAEA
jgi:hypothetical protein